MPQSLSAIPKMAVHSLYVSNSQLAKSSAELALRSAFHDYLSRRIAAVCSRPLNGREISTSEMYTDSVYRTEYCLCKS